MPGNNNVSTLTLIHLKTLYKNKKREKSLLLNMVYRDAIKQTSHKTKPLKIQIRRKNAYFYYVYSESE